MKKKKMMKIFELVVVALLTISIIELLTAIVSSILYSVFLYTNTQSLLHGRTIVLELVIAGLISYIYYKR